MNWEAHNINLSRKKRIGKDSHDSNTPKSSGQKKRRLSGYPASEGITSQIDSLQSTLHSMNQRLKSLQNSDDDNASDQDDPNTDPEHVESPPKKVKRSAEKRTCEYCAATTTPMWRRGPSGKSTLCNKCGVKWRSGRELRKEDGTILPPPSPTTLSRPIKASKQHPFSTSSKHKVSYAQKRHLANMLSLGLLGQEHLAKIVGMIRASMPGLADAQEIELDFNLMEPKLVEEMYLYVTSIAATDGEQAQTQAVVEGANGHGDEYVDGLVL
jgi:GATA zinc finger/Bromodomain extra-terminal - transcription regulation